MTEQYHTKQINVRSIFSYLSERKKGRISDHAKGKWIIYAEYKMPEYLRPNGEDISIEEWKWIFRCRVDDLDVKANRTWIYQDIRCSSCLKNIDETQYHILNCEYLLGKNEHCTINEQKMVHCQDAFTDLYDNILVMTWTLCMSGQQWILGFIWPKKINISPELWLLSSPDTTWYPWFHTFSYVNIVRNQSQEAEVLKSYLKSFKLLSKNVGYRKTLTVKWNCINIICTCHELLK